MALARPGMTGSRQVEGRNDVTFDERQAIEADYVRNWSVWWDLRILFRTPLVITTREVVQEPRSVRSRQLGGKAGPGGSRVSTPVWSWPFPPVSCLTLLVGLHVRTSQFLALDYCALQAG